MKVDLEFLFSPTPRNLKGNSRGDMQIKNQPVKTHTLRVVTLFTYAAVRQRKKVDSHNKTIHSDWE